MGLLSWLFGRRSRPAAPAGRPSAADLPFEFSSGIEGAAVTISPASVGRDPGPVIESVVSGPKACDTTGKSAAAPQQVLELSETHVAVLNDAGEVTVLDREAFEYSRGERFGTDPRQRDLDDLLGRADRVRVLAGGVFRGQARASDVLLDVEDPAAISELRAGLRIIEDPQTFGHCKGLGGPAIELFAGDQHLAALGVHRGVSVRWDRWRHDARLSGDRWLDGWLTARGVEPDLLKLIHEDGYQPGPVRPTDTRPLTGAEQWVCLAEAAARNNAIDQAHGFLSKALAAEPGLPLAHVVRGLIHRDAGHQPAAIRDLTVALEAGFRHPDVLFQRALALDEMGHPREAADDCTSALELNAEHAGALNLRGYIRSLHGPTDEALPDLLEAARLAPGWYVPRIHRGCLFYRQGEYAGAVEAFTEALTVLRENTPPTPPGGEDPALKPSLLLLWWRAEAKRAGDDPVGAEADVVLARERDAFWAAGIGGDLLNQIGESERAEAEFARAIDLRPTEDEPYLGRALARLRGRRPDEAAADYDIVISRQPGAAGVYGLRSTALAAAGRFTEALADCETRLRLTPGDPSARLDRGRVHLRAGAADRARDDFEAAAMLAAHHPVVSGHLVWVLAASADDTVRDGIRALTYGRVACEATQYREPWLLEALAAAQAECGHYDDALETQQKALDVRPGPPSEDGQFRLHRYQNGQPFRLDAAAGLPRP